MQNQLQTKTVNGSTCRQMTFSADVIYKDGHKKHIEFYYGNTYLSQSSRKFEDDK